MKTADLTANETKLFLELVWGGLGVIFLIVAMILLIVRYRKHRECTASVGGRIIGYVKKSISSSYGGTLHPWSYFPMVEFITHDGTLIRQTYNYGESREGKIGNVVVCYNPKKPEVFYLQDKNIDKVITIAMFLAGIMCLCGFIVVLAINI